MLFSQVHSSIHQTLNPCLSALFFVAYVYQTPSLLPCSLLLSLSLPVSPCLSGIQGFNYFPYGLWPLRSHPPCPWPSEPEQPWEIVGGLIYRYGGQSSSREVSRGSHCFTIPQARPVLWVGSDLVMGCAGSEERCQRTCGRHVEIWEVYCNGVMSLFAAPSSQTGRGWEESSSWFSELNVSGNSGPYATLLTALEFSVGIGIRILLVFARKLHVFYADTTT